MPGRYGQALIGLRLAVWLAIIALLIQGCGWQRAPASVVQPVDGTLVVFAAASLTEAFDQVGQLFEAEHPGMEVILNLAGSQQLGQQLAQGAPADVFASANKKEMDNAIQAGRVARGSQQTFARNKLAIIFPEYNPAGIAKLQDLAQPGVKLVLAAQTVPVGEYSLEFLDKASQDAAFGANFKDNVLKNVVSYEQTVKAVFGKIALGEGDAGIVYLTDISRDNADTVDWLDIPDELNPVATYPIAPVSDNAEPDLAQAFIDLVLSPQGQEVLAKFGFVPAK